MKRSRAISRTVWCCLVFCLASAVPASAQVEISGVTQFSRTVELRPQVQGVVAKINVTEGDAVEQGTALIQLDPGLQQARVAVATVAADSLAPVLRAQAELRKAESQLKRYKVAAARGGVPKWEVDEAQWLVDASRAELASAKEQQAANKARLTLEQLALDQFTMAAPFAGVVVEVTAVEGALADGREPLLVLADQSTIEIVAFVSALDVERIKKQSMLTAELGMPVEADVAVTLRYIDPRIDPASGTARAVFAFDNMAIQSPAGVQAFIRIAGE